MTRAVFGFLLCLCCTTAWGQYPIYPAFPQPPMIYGGLSPYGYSPYGFGAIPYGGVNLLPPNPPSPYYVTPSGREYLQQVARREKATYSELKLQHDVQKWDDARHEVAR